MAVSHINESVILEEVMSTHDPDGKENVKINVIFDLVKSILYPTTIGDSIDKDEDSDKEDPNGDKSDEEDSNRILSVRNVQKSVAPRFVRFVKEKFFPEFQIGGEPIIISLDHNGRMVHRNAMHMVLMRGVDICQRMSGGIKTGDSIIPLLQKVLTERISTVRDLVPDIDRKMSEVTNKVDGIINDWFRDIKKQIQNLVDSNIFTSKKEKDLWKIDTWCTKLVVNLGYERPMWVEENRCIFLIGGHDIQWVKTFESKVMFAIQFNPQSKIEMLYVGSNMKITSKIDEDKDCNVIGDPIQSWLFWARLRSIFVSRIKFVEETHGDEECDEILRRVKKLLAYEANDLVVNDWAMLCKGNKIVVCDKGDKMLKVMTEYEKWKENAIAKGFDQAFKVYHDEMLHSASTSLHHHHRYALKYPCNFESVPEDVKCPECCHDMQKFVTFKCCHGSAYDDEAGLDCHDDQEYYDYEEHSEELRCIGEYNRESIQLGIEAGSNRNNRDSSSGVRPMSAGLSVISRLAEEFEQRSQVFGDDAKFLVEVKSGQVDANLNPDRELRRLKQMFEAWKKDYGTRLRETKVILHKLQGNDELINDKMRKKWWGKRNNSSRFN
nr:protein SIEVE ELEMENT OCCLUSION B-like [Ipomoea batatas]